MARSIFWESIILCKYLLNLSKLMLKQSKYRYYKNIQINNYIACYTDLKKKLKKYTLVLFKYFYTLILINETSYTL